MSGEYPADSSLGDISMGIDSTPSNYAWTAVSICSGQACLAQEAQITEIQPTRLVEPAVHVSQQMRR